MSNSIDIQVPDIGDFKDVPVIEVFVKPGDTVKAEDPLVSLESDKATMDVPAPRGGKVRAIAVKVGDKVSEGSVIMSFEGEGAGAAAAPPAEAAKPSVSAPPSPVSAPAGLAEVRVPDIGDFKDVPVIEILVKVGDTVKAEDPLVSLESDKATMDVPAPLSGVVKAIQVQVGDKVSEGSVILVLATGAATAAPSAAPAIAAASGIGAAAAAAVAAPTAAGAVDETAFALAYAGPAVRKLARERGVNLGHVKGSGEHGRILREDVEAFARGGAPAATSAAAPAAAKAASAAAGGGLDLLPWPKVDFAKFGPVERKDLSRIKKISAANLHRNWVVIPHVTTHDEADITELEQFRVQMNKELEKSGVKISMLPFMMKAAVAALKKFPEFNASLDGDALVLKNYWHIGFAADTPNGLVVPVIRDVDRRRPGHRQGDGRAGQAGTRRQAQARPDAGGNLHDQLAGRHRRHLLHADHQRARGLDHGRLQELLEAALQRRQAVPSCASRCRSHSRGTTVSSTAPPPRASTCIFANVLADLRRVLF
jgi:pyruvate dehydrogenase E2 component (dihydrolipoamide acetyltransferase)